LPDNGAKGKTAEELTVDSFYYDFGAASLGPATPGCITSLFDFRWVYLRLFGSAARSSSFCTRRQGQMQMPIHCACDYGFGVAKMLK